MKMPPIGEVVYRRTGQSYKHHPSIHRLEEDWLAQLRIGDEQFVLVWGRNKIRYVPGDQWRPKSDYGEEWDREYGRISGFPECCIDFYVNEWLGGSGIQGRVGICFEPNSEHRRLMAQHPKLGFVPCRKCLDSGAWRNVVVSTCPPPW